MDTRKHSYLDIILKIKSYPKLEKYNYCINYDWYNKYYKNLKTRFVLLCPKHGLVIQKLQSPFDGKGCRYCTNTSKLSFEKIKNDIYKKHKCKYKYLNLNKEWFDKNYKGTQSTWLKIVCPKHGEFLQTVFAHRNGSGCPKCSESSGEKRIREFLEEANINYIQEAKLFQNYRFDFYLPNKNTVIEFDGRQHFEKDVYFGGEKGLKKTQERDKIKNEYCLKNSIRMIRIPYKYMENIEIILREKLNKEIHFEV
jgi:very-short-patch-repair endonuclease